MYLCSKDIFASFYDFSIVFWKRTVRVAFFHFILLKHSITNIYKKSNQKIRDTGAKSLPLASHVEIRSLTWPGTGTLI